MKQTCKALSRIGQPCQAPVASADGYCFFHADPARASRLGRSGGRKNRRSQIELKVPDQVDVLALRDLQVQALRALVLGQIDPRVFLAFTQGCNSLQRLLQSVDTAELRQKVAELEQTVADHGGQTTTDRCSNAADSELHRGGEDTNNAATAGTEDPSTTPEPRSPQYCAPNQNVTSVQDSSGLDDGSPVNIQPDSDEMEQAYDQEEDDREREN